MVSVINWAATFWMLELLIPELRVFGALSNLKELNGSATKFARFELFKIDYSLVVGN